jgi:hypothetical protein
MRFAIMLRAFKEPGTALSSAPANWVRQALCIDVAHVPELLPLEASELGFNHILQFRRLLRDVSSFIQISDSILLLLFVPLFFPIFLAYLASAAYRISFKATALLYAPFVWITYNALENKLTLKPRLERFTKGEAEKLRRVFSTFVLTTAAAKVAVIVGWFDTKIITRSRASRS